MRSNVATYPGTIIVYNTSGQTIATANDSFDLQQLNRGIYILQGRNGSHVETIKVAVGR